jgi:flagellar basal-body rod modification protein FlgD
MSISGISAQSPLVSAQSTAAGSAAMDPAAAASSASSGTTGATSPTDALLDPNQFLSLLVDSLKYQDPLDPTSSADFLQQLASLSQVQTETQVAQTEQTSAAANLIGHTVTGNDPSGVAITGVVTGFSMTSNGPDLDIGNDSVSLGTISDVGAIPPVTTDAAAAPATA